MVIQEILRYLIAHPDAKDTMDGILRWWLPKDLVGKSEGEVQEGLDVLVARRWLTERQTISSKTIFTVNKEKLEEIRAFLRELDSKEEEQRES